MSDLSKVDRKKLELAKLKVSLRAQLAECFAADLGLESRPTPKQLEIMQDELHNIFYIIGSNRSGKSALGAREVVWWFQESHPYKKRKARWGDNPLQILVMGQNDKNTENEIWQNKIQPLLVPGEYKEVRVGNTLQRVENLQNGNTLIFFSHHNAAAARKAVQGFTAHVIWLDEMPESRSLLAELVLRIVTTDGYLFATFTPLVENEEIRRIVDAASGASIKYTLTLYDNPGIQDILDKVIAMIIAQCNGNEAELKARLHGEWYYSRKKVFSYDPDKHRVPLPLTYSLAWRHVAIVDPAASGTAGLTTWAEDPAPATGRPRWYCMMAEYIDGDAAFEQVDKVEERLRGLNLVKRGCDCNPSGFYKEANSKRRKLGYQPIKDKKDNKEDWIQDFNTFLVSGEGVLTPQAEILHEELLNCKRSEETEKIVKESSFHCADTARYFVQLKPRPDPAAAVELVGSAAIRAAWHSQREAQAAVVAKRQAKLTRLKNRRTRWSRRAS